MSPGVEEATVYGCQREAVSLSDSQLENLMPQMVPGI